MTRIVDVAGVPRHMKGWKPDRPDPRDKLFAVPQTFTLPDTADLRPMCPPVVDQGRIGSCTANSSSSALAFLERKAKSDVLFSRLFIYAKTREIEGTPLSEDSGAAIRDVMKVFSTYGAPYESDWPYIESKFSQEPPADVAQKALAHKALIYYRCPDLFTLKASLHQGFPVVIGFSVPDNLFSNECAETGILMPPAPGEGFDGGHAVLAVGYDVNFMCGSEKGAVLCQNSWGTGWGLSGYFWIPMSYFTGGIGALVHDCWTIRRATV